MNNLIKGINTGTIMHEGHLLAIVSKSAIVMALMNVIQCSIRSFVIFY